MSRDLSFISVLPPTRLKDQGRRPQAAPSPSEPSSTMAPDPKANPRSSPGRPAHRVRGGQRDSVSSWQKFAKLEKEKRFSSLDGWKLAICHRVEFPLIRDVPSGEGQDLPPPAPPQPSLLSAGLSADTHQSSLVKRGRDWGRWGLLLPQLMRSFKITRTRQGSLGCQGASLGQERSGKRAFPPKLSGTSSLMSGSAGCCLRPPTPTPPRAPCPVTEGVRLKAGPGRGHPGTQEFLGRTEA